MKFFYENAPIEGVQIPNGPKGWCKIAELDEIYGLRNRIYELTDDDEIVWLFSSNNIPQGGAYINNNIEYFRNVFKKISNKPNIKVVFSNIYEGLYMNDFYSVIVELKKEFRLKKYQVIVITPNFYKRGFEDELTIISEPFLLFDLSRNYNQIKDNDFFVHNYKVELSTTEKYITTDKEKFFLSYNKNVTREVRIYFILWLLKTKLINDTLYSLLVKPTLTESDRKNIWFNSEYTEICDLSHYTDDFNNLPVKVLDWDIEDQSEEHTKFTDTKFTTSDHYSTTLFSIVTETSFDYESLTLTEKTFKPIANCHPFIIVGDYHSHLKLKELGFELYDDLINYSFDDIFDPQRRLNRVFSEIFRIHSLGREYIIDWYKKNIDKIEYNRNKFLEYSKDDLFKKVLNKIKMKKILITGSSGLVGTHLTRKCIEKGYYVIGCDINPSKSFAEENSYYFKYIQMDLTKEDNVRNLFEFEKPDAVFNCFGVKGSPLRAKEKPVDFLYPSFKINTEIINQCAKRKIYLIFMSSVGVYSPSEKFIEEDVWKTLPSSSDWFPSWSKRAGELLLEAYKIQESYSKWSIIRPANIYGEYDDFSGNGTVISSTIKKVFESDGVIECWGDGSPIRDFVYAGDVADGIIKLFEDGIHTITNFGSGLEVTIKQLVEEIVKISGKQIEITWDDSKPNGDLRRLMDTSIQKKYNIMPKRSLYDGLKLTYDYYKETTK